VAATAAAAAGNRSVVVPQLLYLGNGNGMAFNRMLE
jgi:hypothetical protein